MEAMCIFNTPLREPFHFRQGAAGDQVLSGRYSCYLLNERVKSQVKKDALAVFGLMGVGKLYSKHRNIHGKFDLMVAPNAR